MHDDSNSSATKITLEKQMSAIEFLIKSCPDVCFTLDYRDHKEEPLALLLKVNVLRSATTSCNNTNASEVINFNHEEIVHDKVHSVK